MRARLSLCIALMLVTGITAGSATAELVAYYPFGEGQGTATADATGNGNDGTLSSGVEWVPGVKGGAVHFDTAGERIVTTALDPTAKNSAMTLAAWINWEGQGHSISQQGIVGKREGWDPGTGIKWFWQTNPAGDLLFRADWANGGGTGLWWGNGRLVPYADEWTHVAVTWDNGAAVQYVNAVQTDTGNVTFQDTADDTTVSIGCVSATNNETFVGSIDEVRIYDTALTAAEITQAMTGDTAPASVPEPASGATDVPREVVLSWAPGEFAASHDVYFGTDFDAVDQASRTDDRGVLASTGQGPTSYDPDGLLEFGQMYYWRVDEVNAPPDNSISKGQVWNFTAESYAYPITGVTATASSSEKAANGPQNTINGSGLTDDLHSTASDAMWVSSITGPEPVWIQYAFSQPYRLRELWVWNYNAEFEPVLGYGFKDVTIEYSLDGTDWTALADVEFAQATAQNGYAHNTTVDLQGVMARYVRLTANSNWSPVGLKQCGLSEVRFYYVPVKAREPQPADGTQGVPLDAVLSWRPGREAVTHDVYFSSDQQAVADGTAPVETVSEHGFTPAGLEFGTTYYWKVNEVNDAASPSVRDGDVWRFTTTEFFVVDDFESYTDDEGSRIYQTWIDGYTNGNSGSVVGYFEAPFAERTIVHGGAQSMPLEYNNVNTPFFSEAEREFAPVQNWTGNGATHLSLWFRGRPAAFIDRGGNAFAVSGGGHDIWDNADDFRFVYRRLSGNGSLTAKVESLTNTNDWAKAGVMIRETLDDVSRHAMMVVTPANSCSFQRREATSGASTGTNWSGTAVEAPYWVRITRTGNNFKGESSPDGTTWTALGADVVIALGADVYIGLCVTSHDPAQVCAAEFSDVATTGGVTGSWQVAAIGDDPQPANGPDKLYVAVQDSAGKSKTVTHPDPAATTAEVWQQWLIPLSEFTSAGVKVTGVEKLYLGVGDRANPQRGGAGLLYIDDIGFGQPAPTP